MKTKAKKKTYAAETRLIYGKSFTTKWDYSHHLIPPLSSSSTYRLDTTKRGAKGFIEFAHHGEDFEVKSRAPIYITTGLANRTKKFWKRTLRWPKKGNVRLPSPPAWRRSRQSAEFLPARGVKLLPTKCCTAAPTRYFKNWYPRYKIKVTWVDFNDLNALSKAITPHTRMFYFETPVNPTMELIDIQKVVELAKQHNVHRSQPHRIFTVVDNTFATPFCQRPISFGVDFVVNSLTKDCVVSGRTWGELSSGRDGVTTI